MILHIIYDNRRPEKLAFLEAEMAQQAISYTLWPAQTLPSVIASINASHRSLIQYAKDCKMPQIAIAEDDVCFPAKDGWQWFLKNKPVQFDIYVAGTYGGVQNGKPLSNVGLHCYIIHEKYYSKFLNTDPDVHVDTAQDGADIHVCYPMAAIQRRGWSWNNKEVVNYNTILHPKDVYGQIPDFYA